MGALAFGLALAIAVPWYAAKGVHVLPVSVPALWAGATVAGACYRLLGVALGALTRNTIAAVLGGLAWVQIVEVGLLQHFVPALAKWLPTGAAVAITTPCQPGPDRALRPGPASGYRPGRSVLRGCPSQ
jgi:ABC-2 type transport system permease protein